MSFYIKSFRLTPQALEKQFAIPDKSKFTIDTDVVCLNHKGGCSYSFSYFADNREIAKSARSSDFGNYDHLVSDTVEVTSAEWGSGNTTEVPIMVVVTQEETGETKENETSTWVEE